MYVAFIYHKIKQHNVGIKGLKQNTLADKAVVEVSCRFVILPLGQSLCNSSILVIEVDNKQSAQDYWDETFQRMSGIEDTTFFSKSGKFRKE